MIDFDRHVTPWYNKSELVHFTSKLKFHYNSSFLTTELTEDQADYGTI